MFVIVLLSVLINGVQVAILLMTHMFEYVCPNKVKDMNVNVFNLVSGVNETRFLVQHESSECKCELNESVCHSMQKWNHEEC